MNLKDKRKKRHFKIRRKISGSPQVPRLVVHRTNKHIYAQIIDDRAQKTILDSTDAKINVKDAQEGTKKMKEAYLVGQMIAKEAKAKKINKIVFDRAGYKYHGRVKALAQGAREGGLEF